MNYKVGDKVRIREDLQPGKHYNALYFNHEMEAYRGKESVINYVGSSVYLLSCDKGYWYWNDEMLEPVESFEIPRHTINEMFSFFGM